MSSLKKMNKRVHRRNKKNLQRSTENFRKKTRLERYKEKKIFMKGIKETLGFDKLLGRMFHDPLTPF